jgi:hypothetical protein
MEDSHAMPRSSFIPSALLLLSLALLLPLSGFAQAPLEPSQLPPRTSFYFIWRGTPSGDIRKSNALLGLWDDPDFAPLRSAFVEALANDTKKKKDKPALTREELAEFAPLLDNPFTLGYLRQPDSPTPPKSSAPSTPKPAWNGLFFVYDRAGKEELLSKIVLRMRGGDTEIPKLSNLTVAGVPALKIEHKSNSTFWAETGKFAVTSGDLSVFEEILTRLSGKSAGSSLAQSDAFQEALPVLSGGVLEFFFHIPDIKTLAASSDVSSAQGQALLDALKLDSVHSLAGHLSFEGPKTRMQGAILGDTSAGTLFDIWPEGLANPASLAYLSADTLYYNESQINLLGIYNTLKRAFTQGGSTTAPLINSLESMAQTRLGMPIPDALALPTGEFASLQTSPALDPNKQVYLFGIRNKPESLKLLRTVLSDTITSEKNEGHITYLKISLKGGQGSAGVAGWDFYHLAVTPSLLLGASRSDTLRALLTPRADGTTSAPPNFLAARSQFPEKLNGFSFFDLQKLDWPALKQRWITESTKAAHDAKSADTAQTSKTFADWLYRCNPDVFPRHLHSMTGASWKDSKGVHFDEWMD